MNNPNPLIPQGTYLHQKSKARTNMQIAVVAILAIHGVLFGGLLMQAGCKRESRQAQLETNALPVFDPRMFDSLVPDPQFVQPGQPAQPAAPGAEPGAAPMPEPTAPSAYTPAPEPTAAPAFSEYVVKKGDSFYTIAKANSVTINSIAQANPGVNPARLQIGQKLVLPARMAAAPSAPAIEPGTTVTSQAGELIYVVRSGDTLTSIAHKHGTTIKAVKAANNLATDRIRVGQKLKLPASGRPESQASEGRPPGVG
jgi:LysM repeat protein